MSDTVKGTNWAQSGEGFADFMARERERLRAERETIFTQQEELQSKLDDITREFVAIEAYESAKSGKVTRTNANAGRGTRIQRVRKGSRREELLNLIRDGNGLSRSDILERMGLKGDKSGEMSVSNALTALVKRNQIRRAGGKYFAVPEVHQGALPQSQAQSQAA